MRQVNYVHINTIQQPYGTPRYIAVPAKIAETLLNRGLVCRDYDGWYTFSDARLIVNMVPQAFYVR